MAAPGRNIGEMRSFELWRGSHCTGTQRRTGGDSAAASGGGEENTMGT